jgi:hypothetical protein
MDLHIDKMTMIPMQSCALDTIHHAVLNKQESKFPNTHLSVLPITPWCPLLIALNFTLPACWTYTLKSALKMLSITLLSMLSSILPIAVDGTLPACLIIYCKESSQDSLNHTAEHALKYTPNHTWWHSPSLLDYTLPSELCWCFKSHFWACSQVQSQLQWIVYSQHGCLNTLKCALNLLSRTLPSILSSTLPIALDGTLPAYWTLRSEVCSVDTLNHTPEHALKYSFNNTLWHASSLLDCMHPSKLSSCTKSHSQVCTEVHSQLHLTAHFQPVWQYSPKYPLKTRPRTHPSTYPCTPLSRSQAHSQEGRNFQSHMTIRSHVYFRMIDCESSWVADDWHQKAWGRWHIVGSVWCAVCGAWCVVDGGQHMVAELMMLVDIMVWTWPFAHPLWQVLTIPYGHHVENCSHRIHSSGRQFELGESRYPTQIFNRNLLPACYQLWAYVRAFSLGLMEMMVIAMAMAMAIVSCVGDSDCNTRST